VDEELGVDLLVRVYRVVSEWVKTAGLPEVYDEVLGQQVTTTESVEPLEGGVRLEGLQLAQILSSVLKLLFLAASV